MKVFCVVGVSKSGKTTTIEKAIGELKRRGYSVGTIKDIHADCFSLDQEGKNTWRHKNAGAEIVVARAAAETDVMIPRRLEITEVLKYFDQDFVIIEGGREESYPKILTAAGVDEIKIKLGDSVFAISGVISGLGVDADVPVINALSDIEKLTDLIELHAEEIGRGLFV
jgi:molybdopterin-guanine dinucleotide biosynthesis protein B